MEDQAVASTEQVETAAPEAAVAPELSINDLQNLRALVDTAVRRGAFASNELSAVGAIYDRVNTFLNIVAPAAPEEVATPAV